jgi:hypothetical protein
MFLWCMMGNTVKSRVLIIHDGKYSQILDTTYPLEHLSSLLVFCEVCVVQSLLFCVMFCGNVCHFSYDYCIVCPSSISGCWLSFWHLQAFLYVICLLSICTKLVWSLFPGSCTNKRNPYYITEIYNALSDVNHLQSFYNAKLQTTE